jgi:hypothetical protein
MIMSDPLTVVGYGGKINWIVTLVGTLLNTRTNTDDADARAGARLTFRYTLYDDRLGNCSVLKVKPIHLSSLQLLLTLLMLLYVIE